MVDTRALVIAGSFLLLSSGMSLGFGCGDEPPVQIEFQDASEGCNPTPDRLAQPIAQGARLDVTVLGDGGQADVAAAWVGGGSALEVEPEAVDAVGNPVGVRAVAPGHGELHVRLASGEEDSVSLEVAAPASATISADPLTLWNLDTTLAVPFPNAPQTLTSAGYALLPDGVLALGVELRDADGRMLIGHGAAAWTATPGLVTFEEADPLRDDVRVLPGETAGDVLITTAGGGSFALTLVGEQDAASLAVYLPETGEAASSLSLPIGETHTVVLVAFDPSGRLLIGNGADGFEATLASTQPPVAEVVAPPWSSEGGGDIELDEALVAYLRGARVTWVQGLAAGETTLLLSAAGRTTELPVVVTE